MLATSLTGQCAISRLEQVVSSLRSKVKRLFTKKTEKLSLPDLRGLSLKAQRPAKLDYRAKNVFLKMHNAAIDFGGVNFSLADTTKGILYIVRDPRDVGLSYANHSDIKIQDAVKSIAEKGSYIQHENHYLEHEFISSWDYYFA